MSMYTVSVISVLFGVTSLLGSIESTNTIRCYETQSYCNSTSCADLASVECHPMYVSCKTLVWRHKSSGQIANIKKACSRCDKNECPPVKIFDDYFVTTCYCQTDECNKHGHGAMKPRTTKKPTRGTRKTTTPPADDDSSEEESDSGSVVLQWTSLTLCLTLIIPKFLPPKILSKDCVR